MYILDLPKAELVAAYEQGRSSTEMASQFKCSRVAIKGHLRAAGVVYKRRRLDPNEVAAKYAETGSLSATARHFGTSTTPVMDRLEVAGVDYRKKPIDVAQLAQAYRQTGSTVAAARIVGIERHTAVKKLRQAGINHKRVSKYRDCKEKLCPKCERILPMAAFAENKRGLLRKQSWCRKCMYAAGDERSLMRRFGITSATFERMLADQDGGCAICGKAVGAIRNGKPMRLSVDHNHATGLVRGILCNLCNSAVGLFRDDPLLLEKAAAYLRS